ncbi:MAG: homocysteine biosynthesis protein [Syntrophomonadaceae bacterium]|nr:homocysteine biosynthesis protein [Syntrophomonadaceae bacterium]MDD3889504.1 homocysteine biosynthesis protein [Syntrophomonadaceae bacterium]MDD4548669.1 homocysteine biosynthesis protein [Syntrophomonadaceae bacterium]
MTCKKTYEEINEKIRQGEAVVVTAEEVIGIVEEKGYERAAKEIDVVTTGTFGPMCSSGAFINFGHSNPRIKMKKVWLNGVEAYAGIAAVDAYLGAAQLPDTDPENKVYPGRFSYGGGHVIHDLVAGKEIRLEATAYGTDCYPNKKVDTIITLNDVNEAFIFNPRNAYQNYNCAVNLGDRTLYTYMGILKPHLGNASYATAGQLSPLLNDPYYKTLGIGTRIFLGGGIGYVAWNGTQHHPNVLRGENGVPMATAGTLSVIGDLKQMDPNWLVGLSYIGYGATMAVGIGIPIPILDEEILRYTAVKDEDIYCPIVDYNEGYPYSKPIDLGLANFKALKSGKIIINGKEIKTTSQSSYPRARIIAATLKQWIQDGTFELIRPVAPIPSAEADIEFKSIPERSVEGFFLNGNGRD